MKLVNHGKYWFLRITGRVYEKHCVKTRCFSAIYLSSISRLCGKVKYFLFFTIIFYPSFSFGITVSEITNHSREKYDSAKTIIINYRQSIQIKGLNKVNEFKGRAVFTKPDKFRWEGEDAEGQKEIIIIVGSDMTIYLTDTDRLMKRKVIGSLEKQLKERYLPWLLVTNDVRTKYVATEYEAGVNMYKLEILPQSRDDYSSMYFWVDSENFSVIKIQLIDSAENKIILFFDSTVFSPEINKEEFNFNPKSDTQIIEME